MIRPVVVADTGPLNYLILVDCAECLAELFKKVVIPGAVLRELTHARTPGKIRKWISAKPQWLEVIEVSTFEEHPVLANSKLQRGELEAIHLAIQEKALAILIDELDGRKAAESAGLTVMGTLGTLELAAEKGLIDLPAVISKLRETNIFISDRLIERLLQRDLQRKKRLRK